VGKLNRSAMSVKRTNEQVKLIDRLREECRVELMASLSKATMKEKARFIFEILRSK
jgi:hypothetical protein